MGCLTMSQSGRTRFLVWTDTNSLGRSDRDLPSSVKVDGRRPQSRVETRDYSSRAEGLWSACGMSGDLSSPLESVESVLRHLYWHQVAWSGKVPRLMQVPCPEIKGCISIYELFQDRRIGVGVAVCTSWHDQASTTSRITRELWNRGEWIRPRWTNRYAAASVLSRMLVVAKPRPQ